MDRTGLLKMPARKMLAGFGCVTLAIWIVLTGSLPAHADNRTFADLLALAKAQAASGHRWAPAGDNMTETVMSMMDLVPTATAAELAELANLLEAGMSRPGSVAARTPEPSTGAQLPDAAAAPAPPAALGPQVFATAVPQQPAIVSTHPEAEGARLDSSNQTERSQVGSIQDRYGKMAPGELGPGPIAPSQIVPSQIAPDLAGGAISGSRAAVLFARGLDAERHGDLSAARRFYRSAAQLGDAAAARNLGRLYDPAYLKQTALGGVDSDAALARHWYESAVRLGDAEARPLLEALLVR